MDLEFRLLNPGGCRTYLIGARGSGEAALVDPALVRAPEMEETGVGSLWGVPAHLYRSSVEAFASWASAILRGRTDDAFAHEVKLRFLRGFIGQRIAERFYS